MGQGERPTLPRIFVYVHRAPGLVSSVADVFQRAIDALRPAGVAKFAPVPDELMSEENPLFAWDDSHQILLDFLRIGIPGQFEASGNACDVSVNDYPFGNLEPRAQHDVGRLT